MRFLILLLLLTLTATASADEIYLKNGDKITGNIVLDSTTSIIIETEAMGEVRINRSHVVDYRTDKEIKEDVPPPKPPKNVKADWTRTISVSYSDTGGNIDESDVTVQAYVNRKTDADQATFKYHAHIETADNKLDRRIFYGMGRYARSFGEEKKWYHFAKVEGDQDTTKNIDYRILPGYGVGYWFYDRDDLKVTVDTAVGWESTHYDDGQESDSEVVITPHGYFEKTFSNGLKLSEDVTLYPSLSEGEFRLRSETALSGKITEQVSWVLGFLDTYDSNPAGSRKKNDYEITSGIEYEF